MENEESIPTSNPTKGILKKLFADRRKNRSRCKVNKVSTTGETLKSILKQKGDQTAGKRSISKHRSAIKFNKVVSAQLMDVSDTSSITGDVIVSSHPDDAKSVIESTLLKSAEILSDFTENTISQAASYINQFLGPDRFGISGRSPYRQKKNSANNRPWSSGAGIASSVACSLAAEKRKPDISRLPPNIAELLKTESQTSIGGPSTQYHSRKMALRQCNLSNKTNSINAPLKSFADTKAPEIVIISVPIDPRKFVSWPKENLVKFDEEVKSNQGQPDQLAKTAESDGENHAAVPGPSEPSPDGAKKVKKVGVNLSNKSKKKPQKVHLGVEKGVVFVLGPKTKSPYINTFGEARELNTLKESASAPSCRWVLNIGNFHDNEMSFSLFEKNLTITGFRHPTLKYPDGQTVTKTVSVSSDFDAKSLRIYRQKNATDILVLEEVERKGN